MSTSTVILELLPLIGKPLSMTLSQFEIEIQTIQKIKERGMINPLPALLVCRQMIVDFQEMLVVLQTAIITKVERDSEISLDVFSKAFGDSRKGLLSDEDTQFVQKTYVDNLNKLKQGEEQVMVTIKNVLTLEIEETKKLLGRCDELKKSLGG